MIFVAVVCVCRAISWGSIIDTVMIMPDSYRFLTHSKSLALTKMWFKFLRWDDTGITWSLWAVSEETFANLCTSAELSRILPVKHPPDQSLETMEIFLRGLVMGFTRRDMEDDLEEWLSTEEGRDCRPPSAELRYQMHDSESKIDAMLTCAGAVLDSWEFILEKRACGIEMFSLCNTVSEALTDCHHIRRRVLLGVIPSREAFRLARLALTSLEQLYSTFKKFMEIMPDGQSRPGLTFMLGVERVDCRDLPVGWQLVETLIF